VHIDCKSRNDTGNNRNNWNYLKIIHKISEQHTGKTQTEVTTENRHIGRGTCTGLFIIS